MLRVVLKNPKDVQVAIRASWYTVVETFMTIALGYLKCFMGEDNTLLILVSIMSIISLIGDKNHIRYVEYLENQLSNIDRFGACSSNKPYVNAINKILDDNESLPENERVSVISISWGFDELAPGHEELQQAIQRAKDQGLFIVSTALERHYGMSTCGANRNPKGDLEDPNNLGAIIRTCAAAEVDAIIIPKDRQVGINATVMKTSAGAIFNTNIIRVSNLANTIKQLKKNNFWIIGTDMQGTNYTELDYTTKTAIVIGNEGKGMSELTKKSCDFIATIPMIGEINSLNASVSAGIMIYEVVRNRK